MPRFLSPLLVFCCILPSPVAPAAENPPRPRLLVLTDVGGDPDDRQSMIRLLLYANEFEIEGLIATSAGIPGELKEKVTRPDLLRTLVEAYGKVRENLGKHAPGYPTEKYLRERIKSGNPNRGVKAIGEGHDTEGSRWIIAAADRSDPRPLNVAVWGGQTDLAQALWRVRKDRSRADLDAFVSRLRVHDINDQDRVADWILTNFPNLFYVLSHNEQDKWKGAYRGMFLEGDESLTSRRWIDEHVTKGHGPLGALYPRRTATGRNPHGALKEGDTPSWFYFLRNGLGDPTHPEWGGWGGRFLREKNRLYRDAEDRVGDARNARVTVWRWRPAFQADFQARMDWCVKPAKEANHPPSPALNGEKGLGAVTIAAKPGMAVKLSAAGSSDTDGSRLSFRWFVYPEAGTYGRGVPIRNPSAESVSLTVPEDAKGKTIHVILEVTDNGTPRLTRYRRAVLNVGG